jgi:cellulose synthase/poly-beta-1,6-N-acetylglucosamine synthase-like glycosyltransferase
VIERFLEITQWVCLTYVGLMNLGYLTLNVVSFVVLHRYVQRHSVETPQVFSDFEPPVTLIVPAFNEELTVVATVQSLLQLRYPKFEIVVVNDGSSDRTLAALVEAFELRRFPEVLRIRLKTKRVRGVYRSPAFPELRVIDKDNGGKADALNAGINAARYPLFCALDADGILQPDSLRRVVRPFLEDSRTIATGGIVRVANGCDVVGGWLVQAGTPRNPLALLQVVEYGRAFLFGRLGWNALNGVLVISGAFGVFHKETVVEAGGYRTGLAGEDMELVVRLHRLSRRSGRPYRITFVPDPVCWTEAPEHLGVLKRQRVRWQRGLCESLALNADLMINRSGGCVGWIAFPFALLFECVSPLVETAGYVAFGIGYATGRVDAAFALAFLVVSVGLGVLLSASSLLLDEKSFHTYPKSRQVSSLLAASVAENFGFRQLTTFWRLEGFMRWAVGARQVWGEMTRTAGWSSSLASVGRSPLDRP